MNNFKIISRKFFSTKHLNRIKDRRLQSTSATDDSKRQTELFDQELKRQREAVGRIEKIEVQYEGPPENTVFVMNKNLSTPYDCAKRLLSTSATDDSKRQTELFDQELKRQREAVGRIEKIEVQYEGPPENTVFVMNKNLSTPYDCAKHLGDKFRDRAVVALLNGETLWHLHKPLPDACKLELLHYHIPNPASVNKTFWRTCSFLLGAIVKEAFKDNVEVHLHSFPSPNVRTGSFVYDVQLSLDDWKPAVSELKVLSIELIRFCRDDHPIETVDVSKDFALDVFRHSPHKTDQIPDIAAHNGGRVTLFRAGRHVDISRGPMAPDTGHVGRATVTGVHRLETDVPGAPIYRFQGVALPSCVIVNHFAYGLIEERGRSLNAGRIPGSQGTLNEDNSFVASITN